MHTLLGGPAESVMETIRRAGLPIAAQCGGACACGTCHVYVAEDWIGQIPPMAEDEEAMLEIAEEVSRLSRLSCQIQCGDQLDGLAVTLAPGTDL